MAVGVERSHSEHNGSPLLPAGDTTDSTRVRIIVAREIVETCYIIAAVCSTVLVLISQSCYRRMVKAIPQCLHEFCRDAITEP